MTGLRKSIFLLMTLLPFAFSHSLVDERSKAVHACSESLHVGSMCYDVFANSAPGSTPFERCVLTLKQISTPDVFISVDGTPYVGNGVFPGLALGVNAAFDKRYTQLSNREERVRIDRDGAIEAVDLHFDLSSTFVKGNNTFLRYADQDVTCTPKGNGYLLSQVIVVTKEVLPVGGANGGSPAPSSGY